MEEYRIAYVENPEESAWGIIGRSLQNYNVQQTGDDKFERICFVVQGDDEEILGGVMAELYWGWLHIDLLWVKDELRGQGYGQHLLKHAEEEGRQRGAKHVYLDTFSFQAPEFYKKQGYELFGELPDFPPGHKRTFFTKEL